MNALDNNDVVDLTIDENRLVLNSNRSSQSSAFSYSQNDKQRSVVDLGNGNSKSSSSHTHNKRRLSSNSTHKSNVERNKAGFGSDIDETFLQPEGQVSECMRMIECVNE